VRAAAREPKARAHDDLRRAERRVGIAGTLAPLGRDVGPELVVHERRPGDEGRLDVGDRRQRIVIDGDQLDGVARAIRIVGDHHDDRLADEAHPAGGQRKDAARTRQRGVRGVDRNGPAGTPEIGGRVHADHARRAPGRGGVDGEDPRVRVRRA
jgi:hypothetical protein